jgi:DNA/RNA-binding domain of Phe-tRNA-synthetase-like protein
MIEIAFSDAYREAGIEVWLGCLSCSVLVAENDELWGQIDGVCRELASEIRIEDIAKNPAIASSRRVYKAFGKDPARYRLSAEALMRRVVKGDGLYRVNNVVDIVNLVSLETGFSIGGYDEGLVQFPVCLDVGKPSDEYLGIGRGLLNIESLPVLRDLAGAFGSPTSDSVRTAVNAATRRFLMVIFGFGNMQQIEPALNHARELLLEYAGAKDAEQWIIKI